MVGSPVDLPDVPARPLSLSFSFLLVPHPKFLINPSVYVDLRTDCSGGCTVNV